MVDLEELHRIRILWLELSRARWDVKAIESSDADRTRIPVWESEDSKIRSAWQVLTAPSNLEALEAWFEQQDMNQTARETALEAIRCCRTRARAVK